jgi:hypothetical protein
LVSRPLSTLPAKPPSRPATVPPRPKIQPVKSAQSSGPSLLNGTSSTSRTDLAPAASDSAAGEKGRPAVDDKAMPAVDGKAMPAVDKAMPAMDERRAVKRNVAPWRKQQHTGEKGTAVEAAATAEDIYEFSGIGTGTYEYETPVLWIRITFMRIRIRLITMMRIRILIFI